MIITKFDRIRNLVRQKRLPNYRFKQVIDAIFRQRIGQFDRMRALPKTLRKDLTTAFGPSILNIQPVLQRRSKQATKALFVLPDGHKTEAVRMVYKAGWKSFCISSQSGCNFACPFCATGSIGLNRSLTADEIIDQILFFYLQGHKIDSISFMGMGEALANPTIFTAVRVFTDKTLFALSSRRITVSTIGVVPGILRLTREYPQVNLTFSLHSPFNAQRDKLVPLNKVYPVASVMTALDEHIKRTGRKVYLAYVLLKGINDSPDHINKLISLLRLREPLSYLYHVNLIRYHPTVRSANSYQCSDQEGINRFYQGLKAANIRVTIRQSFGEEIEAACGQLYGRYSLVRRQV